MKNLKILLYSSTNSNSILFYTQNMDVYTYLAGNWIGSTLELTESISASSVYVRFENICFGLFPGSSILSYMLGGEMKFFFPLSFSTFCVLCFLSLHQTQPFATLCCHCTSRIYTCICINPLFQRRSFTRFWRHQLVFDVSFTLLRLRWLKPIWFCLKTLKWMSSSFLMRHPYGR